MLFTRASGPFDQLSSTPIQQRDKGRVVPALRSGQQELKGALAVATELNRHKGEFLPRQGQPEAAEILYRKALSIAEEQGPSFGNCAPP